MEEKVENLTISEELKRFSADILEWKRKYASIYYLKIGNHEYVFRLLTKGEYLALYFVQFHISSEAEDILLDKCILYPTFSREQRGNLLAGEVTTLVDKILSLSGFSDIENIKADLDKERLKIQLLDNQIVLVICKAFPHITPTDIDNFDYPTTLHYISLAEELLGTKLEISKTETNTKTIDFEKDNREQGFIQSAFTGKPNVKK
jgi:hypothetical protein